MCAAAWGVSEQACLFEQRKHCGSHSAAQSMPITLLPSERITACTYARTLAIRPWLMRLATLELVRPCREKGGGDSVMYTNHRFFQNPGGAAIPMSAPVAKPAEKK